MDGKFSYHLRIFGKTFLSDACITSPAGMSLAAVRAREMSCLLITIGYETTGGLLYFLQLSTQMDNCAHSLCYKTILSYNTLGTSTLK